MFFETLKTFQIEIQPQARSKKIKNYLNTRDHGSIYTVYKDLYMKLKKTVNLIMYLTF